MVKLSAGLTPEPRWKQGPDTPNAQTALAQWLGETREGGFNNVWFFSEPTFTGASYEFLRFDYGNSNALLETLRRRGYRWEPSRAQKCEHTSSPDWWLHNTKGITRSSKDSSVSRRLCLDEVNHRAYFLTVGH